MLKRYCAFCSKYSITLELSDWKNITLEFSGKNPLTKERFADVSDPLIQEALEKTASFNVYYYKSNHWNSISTDEQIADLGMSVIPGAITFDYESEKVEQKEEQNGLIKKEFQTGKDAKSWLNSEHHVSFALLGNKQAIIEKGLELGFEISFTN